MFERYTESARRTLFYARYEAGQVGGGSIDPEHVLLGMLRESGALVGRIFTDAGISYREIRQQLDAQTTARHKVPTSVEIPFSEDTKRVLRYATDEADRLAHDHVAVAHLLIGVLRQRGSLAERYLVQRGVSVDRICEQMRGGRESPAGGPSSRPTPAEALMALQRVSALLAEMLQSSDANVGEFVEGIELELQLVERALGQDT